MSRVMLLPGSRWQVPLAERVKEMGHWLCVVSPEEEPPCAAVADDFFRSDIFDVDAIEGHARALGVEAVLSDECDIAMPVVAELGERLGARTLSREAAALYTDKFLMREFCAARGLNSPEHALCKDVDEAVGFFVGLGRPIVIKPLDSNASHGVFTIRSEEELRDHFDEAMSFSRVRRAVLAERFIDGTEFTVDGVKTPTAHHTLAISEKRHFAHDPNIANELHFTHRNPSFDYEALKRQNDAFVLSSPLEYGLTHAEYKFEDGKFHLIEIGARGGGNRISSVITQFMSGRDAYRYLVGCATGEMGDADFTVPDALLHRAAILKFFHTPHGGGVVKGIDGLDYLESEPDVVEYRLNFGVGDTIEDAKNDSARIGYFIACSEDERRLREVVHNVESSFRIHIDWRRIDGEE